jgi:hypothetical protein
MAFRCTPRGQWVLTSGLLPAVGDLPFLGERHTDRDSVRRSAGDADELDHQEERPEQGQDVGRHGDAWAGEHGKHSGRRQPDPERPDDEWSSVRREDVHDEERAGKAGHPKQGEEEPQVPGLHRPPTATEPAG